VSATEIVVLVVVVLVLLAVVGFVVAQQRKRKQLQSRFGPEYDRTVESSGKRRDAERDLAERAERRQQLDIRPLPEQERRAFADRWRQTQEAFVDQPSMAVRQADRLVAEVMARRGYPVGDFQQQARDVSVDHAHVVEEYRAAHNISELNDREQASTEQLRQAMVHYRALFTDLLQDDGGSDERGTRDDLGGATDGRGTREDVGYASDEDRRASDGPYEHERRGDGRTVEGGFTPTSDRTVSERDLPRESR